jgi:hypothetical protein
MSRLTGGSSSRLSRSAGRREAVERTPPYHRKDHAGPTANRSLTFSASICTAKDSAKGRTPTGRAARCPDRRPARSHRPPPGGRPSSAMYSTAPKHARVPRAVREDRAGHVGDSAGPKLSLESAPRPATSPSPAAASLPGQSTLRESSATTAASNKDVASHECAPSRWARRDVDEQLAGFEEKPGSATLSRYSLPGLETTSWGRTWRRRRGKDVIREGRRRAPSGSPLGRDPSAAGHRPQMKHEGPHQERRGTRPTTVHPTRRPKPSRRPVHRFTIRRTMISRNSCRPAQ